MDVASSKDFTLPPIGKGNKSKLSQSIVSGEVRPSSAGALPPLKQQPKYQPISEEPKSSALNIEGQRILSVLQEAQRKIQFIQSIPDVPDRNLAALLGDEVLEVIKVITM
jgi:hypothetical protein